MKVTVLFFGATADTVGSRELEIRADEAATAKSIIDQLSKDHPALAKHKLLIAINEEYADPDTLLKDGEEVALFTAVSGG
ncbi:MAG: MoaD/ThiS family protein [bacterium]|nr:MoaD/ThiS family protein [bacterium]